MKGGDKMRIRITEKMLAEVPEEVRDMYIFYQRCVQEDYKKYGSAGVATYALYKASRARVIEILRQKKLI